MLNPVKKERITESLPHSITTLIQLIESDSEPLTPERLVDHINTSDISEKDLLPWADFSHPIADSYGRKLLYESGHFEVMVMSWVTGDYSAIHDHGGAQWGAVKYFGAAEHFTYTSRDGELQSHNTETTRYGQINIVDHELIHLMGNPLPDPFITLHVYGTNRDINPVTLDSRVFDLYHREIQYTDGGMFFLLPAAVIKRRASLPEAELVVTQKHNFEMLRRAERMLGLPNLNESQQISLNKIASELADYLFSENDVRHFHQEVKALSKEYDEVRWSAFWNDMTNRLKPS